MTFVDVTRIAETPQRRRVETLSSSLFREISIQLPHERVRRWAVVLSRRADARQTVPSCAHILVVLN